MLSLKTIGERANTREVTLRGKPVTVRGLTIADHAAIDAVYPPPPTPRKPDPNKGDLAPPIADIADPGYRRAVAERVASVMAAQAAVALSWQTGSGAVWSPSAGCQACADYLTAAVAELADAGFTRAELDMVLDAVESAERCEGEDPRGN